MHSKIYHLLLLPVVIACTSPRFTTHAGQAPQNDSTTLCCLKVTQLLPLSIRQGNRAVFLACDTMVFYIYSYKDMFLSKRLYKQQIYARDWELVDRIPGQEYFVYKKGRSTGNLYDSLLKIVNERRNVDSVMQLVWKHNRYKNPDIAVQLAESRFEKDNQTLVEKYTFFQLSDTSGSGSDVFFFSEKPYPKNLYSLWPEMDSIKKMKLYKCFTTYNQRYFKDADILADAYISSQFGEIVVPPDTARVMSFFRQEEQLQKSNVDGKKIY